MITSDEHIANPTPQLIITSATTLAYEVDLYCECVPLPVFTVVGLKAFHTMVSQMLVAIKREIPEPKP